MLKARNPWLVWNLRDFGISTHAFQSCFMFLALGFLLRLDHGGSTGTGSADLGEKGMISFPPPPLRLASSGLRKRSTASLDLQAAQELPAGPGKQACLPHLLSCPWWILAPRPPGQGRNNRDNLNPHRHLSLDYLALSFLNVQHHVEGLKLTPNY
jgi:hypothetical protein